MRTIVLVACVATKANIPSPAEELYQSALFRKAMAYAKSLKPDDIFILSAKHYLLPIRKVIAPYNKTLTDFNADEKKEWSEKVIYMLKKHGYRLDQDKFILLAGNAYRKYLEPEMKYSSAPLQHFRIGQQMAWLGKQVQKLKETLIKIKNIIYEAIKKINK